MPRSENLTESALRRIVQQCVRRELPAEAELPDDAIDLIEAGVLDSMAWVGVLRCIESATGVSGLANRMTEDEAQSIQSLVATLSEVTARPQALSGSDLGRAQGGGPALAGVVGWDHVLGSQQVDISTVERQLALPAGKLRERAGIESVARASADEDEATLATRAAEAALRKSGVEINEVDWILATSETFLGFPSLAALVHSRLLARETCGALDIGGACAGLVNCLGVAQSLVASAQAARVLVVTAEVHSRVLAAGCVPGEFAGLFGDGASAFLVARTQKEGAEGRSPFVLCDFQFGCAGTFASALRLGITPGGGLDLTFDGPALARAAVENLQRIVCDLALRNGLDCQQPGSLVIHQPNPRLVELFARQMGVPLTKIPLVARYHGNLGSSTCGVALSIALAEHSGKSPKERGPIFVAAVGPGLLWAGALLR